MLVWFAADTPHTTDVRLGLSVTDLPFTNGDKCGIDCVVSSYLIQPINFACSYCLLALLVFHCYCHPQIRSQ